MSLKNKKVLLTYGPTAVPIDNVRVITNISSGSLGRFLIEELLERGARLTVLEGPVRQPSQAKGIRKKNFFFFDDLQKLLTCELDRSYDILIHAAAVSDYRARSVRRDKIGSGQKKLKLNLIPTPKLIAKVKKQAPDIFLVGFKLEPRADIKNLKKKGHQLIRSHGCDLVVANTLPPGGGYAGLIMDREGHIWARAGSRRTLTRQLMRAIEDKT